MMLTLTIDFPGNYLASRRILLLSNSDPDYNLIIYFIFHERVPISTDIVIAP